MDGRSKRVGIITMYGCTNLNFGATLQAYALTRKVRDLGYDAWVLDFVPKYGEFGALPLWKRLARLILHPTRIITALARRVKKACRKAADQVGKAAESDYMSESAAESEWKRLWSNKRMRWEQYCHRHIHATKPMPERILSKVQEKYDILIVGSDQVWNPLVHTDAFFLPYKKKGRKKIAYAASIACPKLTWDQKLPFLRWLPDFDYVTVRESEGKRLLESFLNIPVRVVLDPTFFLSATDWDKVADPIDVRNQVAYRGKDCVGISLDRQYILFLVFGVEKSLREFASRVAQNNGLRLVILSASEASMRASRCIMGEEMVDVTPGQFLTLVRGAALVITDSFHCTAFSINYRRNFYVLRRNSEWKSEDINSRIYSLCRMLGLEGQIVTPSDASKVLIRDDLYEGVEEKLEKMRKRSEKILLSMLRGI